MPKTAIIFDFDGVLADSFEELFALNCEAMRRIGRSLTRRDYRGLFVDNIHRGLTRLINNEEELEALRCFKADNFSRYYSKVKLFPFAKKLITSLSKTHNLGIVSSTKKRFIEEMLRKHKVRNNFKIIFGSTAHSKEKELKQAVLFMKAACDRTVFVTDTVGDIKAGKKLGLNTVAVAWGFQSRGLLRKAGPDKTFADYRDFASACKGYFP